MMADVSRRLRRTSSLAHSLRHYTPEWDSRPASPDPELESPLAALDPDPWPMSPPPAQHGGDVPLDREDGSVRARAE